VGGKAAVSMIEIDKCHIRLIGAMLGAAKPKQILELGFGTGSTTVEILQHLGVASDGNDQDYKCKHTSLTLVDNWLDFGGVKPTNTQRLQLYGVNVVTSDESEFLNSVADNTYDFLVSDADHRGDWCEEHFRVTKPGSWCFFHDTNQPHVYPGLARTVQYVKDRGWTHYHFTKSTLPGEECHRGLLMCLNEKDSKP